MNHLPLAGITAEEPDVETASDGYARRFAGPVGDWFLDMQARTTLALLAPLPPELQILDVGGGHAQLAPPLIDAGHQVTVLGSAAVCGERLRPWSDTGRCRFEVGSLQTLPYQDRSFDVVLSFRLLAHAADPRALLGELCRVARRAVIVDYPSTRSLNVLADRLFALKLGIEKNTRTFTLFSPRDIRDAFEGHGFRVADSRPQFLLPMALHRLLGSAAFARALEMPGRLTGATHLLGSPVIVRADRTPLARSPA